jgi:glycosyltransferase 2 family protein
MSSSLKRTVHWIGGGFTAISLGFIAVRLNTYRSAIDVSSLGWATGFSIALLALLYGSSNIMLALAWRQLLMHFKVFVSRRWAIWGYGVSQIARYMPGNIFHLVGRQAIGAAAGIPNWPLAKSTIWELGLIAFTGSLFGILIVPKIITTVSVLTSIVVFSIVITIAILVTRKFLSIYAAIAISWYTGFLFVSGFIFIGVVSQLSLSSLGNLKDWSILVGAYIVAWLIGLVTPGSPAGAGIRELVILLLLDSHLTESTLITAVLITRFITVVGDCLFYLVTVLTPTKKLFGSN